MIDSAQAVLAATDPTDIFGTDDAEAEAIYRRLRLELHPDRAGDGALAAAQRLGELWDQRIHGVALRTRKGSYRRGALITRGDIAAVYRLTSDDPTMGPLVLKVAQHPSSNDLLQREAHALRLFATEGEERHRPYVPEMVETFTWRDPVNGANRVANILHRLDGFVSFADVHAAYPDGLDPRDVAWMWRRLLVAVGFAHRTGLVHTAVVPEHVLIHPEQHGLVLIDWCWSTTLGQSAPAILEQHRAWYPAEVTDRQPVTAATDIYMVAQCVAQLMGGLVPAPMATFLRGCRLPSDSYRPNDAWSLLGDFDNILAHLYGPRTFRPFTMPTKEKPR